MPLKKLWPSYFSLSGLMAGAVAPDLLYFLTGTTEFRYLSHTWTGLFFFCLPVGLLFVWGFHWFFKGPVVSHLPTFLRLPLSGLAESQFVLADGRTAIVLIVSVFIGALSHFGWDAFTHPGGYMTRRIDWLMQPVTVFGITRSICRIFQHISSLLGGLAVIYMIFWGGLIPKPPVSLTPVPVGRKMRFWTGGMIAAVAGGVASAAFWSSWFGFTITYQHSNITTITSAGLGLWAGFFWYAVLVGFFSKRRASIRFGGSL